MSRHRSIHSAVAAATAAIIPAVIASLLLLSGCADEAERSPGIDSYIRGIHQYKADDRAGATASFQKALRENPSLRMAHAMLGEIYRTEGNYAAAAGEYRACSDLDPYSASAAYYLGLCDQLLDKLEDAATAYLRALRLEPNDCKASTNLGLVYLSMGRFAQANHYLERATELDPRSDEAWTNYGVGLDAAGRLGDAEMSYRRALEIDSGATSTLQDLAANLIAQGKAREALETCDEILLRVDTPLSRTRYGQALVLSRNPEAALRQFNLALQRDPNFYLALTEKGFLLIDEYRAGMELDENKREAAMDLWRASLRVQSDQPRALAALKRWQASEFFGK